MSYALDTVPYAHSRLVETEHGMMLMNNYYSKTHLVPTSMIGLKTPANLGSDILNISTSMTLHTTVRGGFRHHNCGVTKDPYIENRYYIVQNNHHSGVDNTYSYLTYLHETESDVNVIRTVAVQYIDWERIVDIDDIYLYVTAHHLNNRGAYIYKLNKNTGAVTLIFNCTNTRTVPNLIHKDETYLYFIMRVTYSQWYLVRLNKSTGETKSKTINPPSMQYLTPSGGTVEYGWANGDLWLNDCTITHENFYCENGRYYWIMPQRSGAKFDGKGNANNNIIAFYYDSNRPFDDANVVSHKLINIQDNKELTHLGLNAYVLYRTWVIGSYLYYAIYDESNSYTEAISIQGIHKFRIKPGFELEWISVERINADKPILSMVLNSDKTRILVGYNQSFDVLAYNQATGDYELGNKEVTRVRAVGFDSLDRIWYQTTDGAVHVQNSDDPQEVIIRFERSHYTYTGGDIHTYLTFEAKDFSNSAAVGTYVLSLTGNAYFDANGTKEYKFYYSGGILQINLTMHDAKRVTCFAEYIKTW